MGRLALAVGSSFLGDEASLPLAEGGETVLLQRHGLDAYRPPHLIDHRANLAALAEAGCDRVLAVSSVGSLRTELAVGTLVCPDDFIALHLGCSAYDDARGHRVPGFDPTWRTKVVSAWERHANPPLRDGGVYWQAIGPRFETPAEIRLIGPHADVIGMTVAAEAIVAGDLGLRYAAVCAVDNLANGIGAEPLTPAEYEAGRAANRATLLAALEQLVPRLAEDAK
jgi:5'-methylthioadenosine phosphorylase